MKHYKAYIGPRARVYDDFHGREFQVGERLPDGLYRSGKTFKQAVANLRRALAEEFHSYPNRLEWWAEDVSVWQDD